MQNPTTAGCLDIAASPSDDLRPEPRKKMVYVLRNIPASRNTTRFQRILALSGAFDLTVLLACGPVPEELRDKARFSIFPRRGKAMRFFAYPFWCFCRLFLLRRGTAVTVSSCECDMIIAGYLGARMSSGKWVADIFDHPSLGLDSAVSQPLLKGMLLRGYASATSRIAGRLLKKADIVLCTLVPEALDGYGIPQSRLVPLTNGIDLHAAGEGRGGLQKGHRSRRFRVLYVGFVLRVRGINEILDAADALRQKYPDLEWVLAGKSNAGEQDWLKMEMDRRKLPGTVTFLGELSHGDVLELVQMSDVCLFTFPRTATTDFIYPVKIFEYMAYGKPIVATSLKGVQQILEHGKNGLLVRPGDAKALAAAVEELYLNRELGERLGNAARKNAPKYDWREINRQVVSVLERSAVGHQIHS